MTEVDLLDAIDADPDADPTRLAHADWLEAKGDSERAAYIRSHLRDEGGTARTAGLPTDHGLSWECRRGYPEVVRFTSLASFKRNWLKVVAHRPRHVVFHSLRSAAKLADEPGLSAIRSVGLSGFDPPSALAVLRSPHLAPLHHLEVNLAVLPDLARMPLLAKLRSLHCSFASEDAPAVEALLASSHLGALRWLRFGGMLSPQSLRALWRSSSLRRLEVLELLGGHGWCGTETVGLGDLGDGGAVPDLVRFNFEYHCGEDDARAIARATRWTRLRELTLGGSWSGGGSALGDNGVTAIVGAAHLVGLERLRLARADIGDAGAAALAAALWPRLAQLDLTGNLIGRVGVAALGRSASLPALREIRLQRNPAPSSLIEAVQERYRLGAPPIEEAAPVPVVPLPSPTAPVIGEADEDGLVRAILADPWDKLARMAYADWLEEQGKPLHAALQRGDGTLGPLADAMKADAAFPFKIEFTEEGLLRVAVPVRALRSKAWERDGPAWLRQHHVAEVRAEGGSGDWAAVYSGEWLASVRGLRLEGDLAKILPGLASSRHLEGLAALSFQATWLREEVFGDFFKKAAMRGLCRIMRRDYYLPETVLEACAESAFAPCLRRIETGVIGDAGLEILGRAPGFSALATLSFRLLDEAGAKLLADAERLDGLRHLALAGEVEEPELAALAGSVVVSRLSRLKLSLGSVATGALERFARALPSRCLLVVQGIGHAERAGVEAILGERLIVEGA